MTQKIVFVLFNFIKLCQFVLTWIVFRKILNLSYLSMSRFLWPWVFWLHINFIYWEIAQGNGTVIAFISEYLLSIHVS